MLKKFKEWETAITSQTECNINSSHADIGGEYTSTNFEDFLKEKRICNGTTVPHSPRQNGVAERMSPTLQQAALSTILRARLSKVSGRKQFM